MKIVTPFGKIAPPQHVIDEISVRLEAYWHSWEDSVDAAKTYYDMGAKNHIWDGTAVDGPGWQNYGDKQVAFLDEVETLTNNGTGDVQMFGNDAMVVTVAALTNGGTLKNGDTIDATMRETLVWHRSRDEWTIVHEHTSPMPKED